MIGLLMDGQPCPGGSILSLLSYHEGPVIIKTLTK